MTKVVEKCIGTAFSVSAIPVLKDNYTYIIHDRITNTLAAVDVSDDFTPVLDYIKHLTNTKTSLNSTTTPEFRTILSTHKHWDHAGGNTKLPQHVQQANGTFRIIGGVNDKVPGATETVREGDKLMIGALQVEVLDTPCHTKGHVMYKVYHPQDINDGCALFTGDTMFIGGIGAFFEGNAADMCRALKKVYHLNKNNKNEKNSEAADNHTFIFPGHEYTVNFLKFTCATLPSTHPDAAFVAAQLERYKKSVAQHKPTVPSTLAEEKLQNLFLRTCDEKFIRGMNHGTTPEALMQYLYNSCP
ncbi:Hydroxyacylglutathione hydrolase [Trypanosoma melophagium]|uniref:Hydroxyacylglutathione hydrolase n=1 Tax=Trypanosoma melophagium TaxID=715481 RepID=UPI00351AA327|nr:Hydroxyacylglutathione hydrolase [Trypanosoma melophagium]